MNDFLLICIWSDYDWCFKEDLEDYLSFKSDDYKECKYYFLDSEPTYKDIVNLHDFGS